MKVRDIFDGKGNYIKAKRVAIKAKEKSKKANPGDEEGVTGWRGDPHQGSHVSITWLKR